MNNDSEHTRTTAGDPRSSTPLDPTEPGMNPAGLPGSTGLPGKEGEIPLSPEQSLPLPDDDPLAPEDPPSAAM